MTWLRRGLLALFAIVAVATAIAGWVADPAEVTAAEAVRAAEHAFAGAEVEAEVDGRPVADTYASRNQPTVAVWRVSAAVGAGEVELFLARADAHPVAIDDRSEDRADYLLSAASYEAVIGGIEDPSRARATRERVALTVGALLVVASALGLALADKPGTRR